MAVNCNELEILIMTLLEERVGHMISQIIQISLREFCYAFQITTKANVKGEWRFLGKFSTRMKTLSYGMDSYDGNIFHNQTDSNTEHQYISLATFDEAPMAVGGKTAKAEILDISSNTWTEIEDYPYHNR